MSPCREFAQRQLTVQEESESVLEPRPVSAGAEEVADLEFVEGCGRMLVQGDADTPFSVMVEPEAMSYDLPSQERVLLTFRGPVADAQFEVVHGPDYLTIWRPADTEVWATLADGTHEQIGGWSHIPAPWLDSAHPDIGPPPWERS